uniref:U-box domain-containing protein n=1 Tax=Oryza rufipogon TaxID=4529 RepID=A0A0E0RGC8_ORYRU
MGSSTVAAAAAIAVTSSSTAAAAAVAAAASSSAAAPATRSRVIDREFGMLLLARRSRKAVMVKAQASLLQKRGGAMAELAIPAHFQCPISLDLMRDLVMATMGITYDREGIEAWLDTGRAVCPITHAPLWLEDLVPNHAIRHVIQDWCVANRSHGVERIPTPKIPATPIQASEMLFNVAESARCGAAERATERSLLLVLLPSFYNC